MDSMRVAVNSLKWITHEIQWRPHNVVYTHCSLLYCPEECQSKVAHDRLWLVRRRDTLAFLRRKAAEDYRITVYRADGTSSGPGAWHNGLTLTKVQEAMDWCMCNPEGRCGEHGRI